MTAPRSASVALAALMVLLGWSGLSAQPQSPPGRETALVREAANLEARNDHPGAERVLRSLLDQFPSSAGGLFAIERALRSQDRLSEVLPLIDVALGVDPRIPGVRAMKLRILTEVDSLSTLEREVEEWVRAEPQSPEPYRELARMYERAYGPGRAIALLRDGRRALGDPAAFSLEVGDLLLRTGQVEGAAHEWSLALGGDGALTSAVLRRVGELPKDSVQVVHHLLDALATEPTTVLRRQAGVQIAMEAGLLDAALRFARDVTPTLAAGPKRMFLEGMARRAEQIGAPDLVLWAAEGLRQNPTNAADLRATEIRIVQAALATGDTTRALAAQLRLAESLPPASEQRLRVMVELIRIESHRVEPALLERRLEALRAEFPGASALDELASVLASGLWAQGHREAAASVLTGVRGPRSTLERAFMRLDEGDIAGGEAALREAIASLPPAMATETIQLLSLLARVSRPGAGEVARAAVLNHRGATREAVDHIVDALVRLPERDHPALLAHAARIADGGDDPDRAAELRGRLLHAFDSAPEAAEATLGLARWQARSGRSQDAVALLEALIVDRPNSPLVPDARRELDRLRSRPPGGPS